LTESKLPILSIASTVVFPILSGLFSQIFSVEILIIHNFRAEPCHSAAACIWQGLLIFSAAETKKIIDLLCCRDEAF